MRHGWVMIAAGMLACHGAPALAACAAETGFVDAGGTSLRYRREGCGPDIVILHEIGMAIEGWDEVAKPLSRKHRVLRYDIRGFGLSEKVRGTVTMADEVADLGAMLDAMGMHGPVVLVGGALGASIAFGFAADHPERVRGIYALSPVVPMPAVAPVAKAATPLPKGSSPTDILATQGVRAYLTAQEDELYPPRLRRPDRYARFRAIQLASDPVGRVATVRMLAAANVAGFLSRVTVPTQAVATAQFPLQPPDKIAQLCAALPRCRMEVMDTGHLAALASPEEVTRSILRFVMTLSVAP